LTCQPPYSRSSHDAFPILRWIAVLWLVIWIPAYLWTWGWRNFLLLCDLAVLLSALGIWRSSSLLLSSQAVSTLLVGLAWGLDLVYRGLSGHHLIGGTEYFWDSQYPLGTRLLSLYHLLLPLLLLWCLRRLRYHPRAWRFQCLLAALVLVLSRLIAPGWNLNFVEREPLLGRAWGPAPVHLAVVFLFTALVVYWPVHRLLLAAFPQRS
jgi:hypothetical protein